MKAIKRASLIVGNNAELGRRIAPLMEGVDVITPQRVWNWINLDVRVPPGACQAIEKVTYDAVFAAATKGLRVEYAPVTAHELRPDVFRLPSAASLGDTA